MSVEIALGIAGDMVHGAVDPYTTKVGGSPVRPPHLRFPARVLPRPRPMRRVPSMPVLQKPDILPCFPQAWMGDLQKGCPTCRLCSGPLSLVLQVCTAVFS